MGREDPLPRRRSGRRCGGAEAAREPQLDVSRARPPGPPSALGWFSPPTAQPEPHYPSIKPELVELTVALHGLAHDEASRAAFLADAQKAGLDVAKLKVDMQDPAVDKAISAAHQLASAGNIDGTPAFVVNGQIREGNLNEDILADMVKNGKTRPSS